MKDKCTRARAPHWMSALVVDTGVTPPHLAVLMLSARGRRPPRARVKILRQPSRGAAGQGTPPAVGAGARTLPSDTTPRHRPSVDDRLQERRRGHDPR
ncbi:hypothetical protein EVAR_83656_1 [Eumeta japonica]|uniref:Uncharacterized protein n=1 Tax=Eumeta variegata TaxID=151549 RepID=A0A4C1UNL4_EUMVA|nr:hypothetical protein EVAR_83656_1 [Eumeta japonica]